MLKSVSSRQVPTEFAEAPALCWVSLAGNPACAAPPARTPAAAAAAASSELAMGTALGAGASGDVFAATLGALRGLTLDLRFAKSARWRMASLLMLQQAAACLRALGCAASRPLGHFQRELTGLLHKSPRHAMRGNSFIVHHGAHAGLTMQA